MEALKHLLNFVLFMAAGSFTMASLHCLVPFQKQIWKRAILLIGCFLLSGMIIYIGDWANLPPTFLIFLFCVWFCCEGSLLQKITVGLMFASTGFAFNALIDNFMLFYFGQSAYVRPLFWLLIYIGLRHYAPERDYELSPSLWKLLLMLTLTPLGIVLSCVLLTDGYDIFPSANLLYLILLTIALLTFIGLLWAIIVLAKQTKLEQEHMLSGINQKYYEEMERQHFEIRRLRHDLANHLQAVAALPENNKDAYIQKLLDDPAVTHTLNCTGDSTVNAVLSSKDQIIKENSIAFHLKAEIPAELPFEKPDVCAIFANALDNAIEACLKLPEGQRKISLETKAEKGLFVLSINNPAMESAAKTGILPKTTKKDTFSHGLGLKSIHEVVKRYNGQMEIKTENNCFQLFLYLPLSQSTSARSGRIR